MVNNNAYAQNLERNIADHEVLDLILLDGELEYGIVQASKFNDRFCIYDSDLFSVLGYSQTKISNECLTENQIEERLKIRVSIDISKMRVLVHPDQNYPVLDMLRAKHRYQRNLSNSLKEMPIARGSGTRIPTLTGIGLDVGQSNFYHFDYSKFSSRIQLFDGNLANNVYYTNGASKSPMATLQYESQWRWYSKKSSSLIQNIYLGNNIGLTLNQKPYDGLYVSNRNQRRVSVNKDVDIGIPLSKGTILEWYTLSGQDIQSIVVSDTTAQIPLKLQYGLNTLNVRVTEPGSTTKEITRNIYLADGMISKGKTEYEIKFGRGFDETSKWIFGTSLKQGVMNGLNVMLDLEQHELKWNKNTNRFGLRAIMLDQFDVVAKVNSKLEHDIYLSNRNTSHFNFSLRDAIPSLETHRFSNHYKRLSQFQWSTHLGKNFSIQGASDRRESAYTKEYNSMFSAAHHWRYFITRSQFSYRSIRFDKNIKSKSITNRLYIGKKINHNFVLSLESQLSRQINTRIESIALSAQYYGSKVSVQSSITRLPGLNNTMIQFGLRNLGRHIISTNTVNYSSNDIQHWSMHSTKWGFLQHKNWINMSTSSMDLVGINFVAFYDENANGKKDKNESALIGLRATSTGTRLIEKGYESSSVLLMDMIPKNNYWINFEQDLSNYEDLIVEKPRILVQAPSSGIRTLYVPCVPAKEVVGSWSSNDFSISAHDIQAMLVDVRSGNKYRTEWFNDQTWIAYRIPEGTYTLEAQKVNGEKLKIHPNLIEVSKEGSNKDLTLKIETT